MTTPNQPKWPPDTKRIHLRVRADRACWTSLSQPAERISSIVPSPSAERGFFRSILGKWENDYVVHECWLLKEPRLISDCKNEIQFKPSRDLIGNPIKIEDSRVVRMTTMLCEPEYLFVATPIVSWYGQNKQKNDPTETQRKYWEMLTRRLRSGQTYRGQPWLGLRECPGSYEYIENLDDLKALKPVPITQNLGISYWGTDWSDPQHPRYYAQMNVVNGIIHYPTLDEVRRYGIKQTGRAA